jgi:hypothetical protein
MEWCKCVLSTLNSKFYSLIKALEYLQTNEYEYVCILDTDVSFYDKSKSIKQYLEGIDALDKDFVMGLDCVAPETYYNGKYPNGGVYLFKNTDIDIILINVELCNSFKLNGDAINQLKENSEKIENEHREILIRSKKGTIILL